MASDLARSRAYIPLFTIRATAHPFSRLSPTEARQRLGPACSFLPSSLKKSRFRPGELISKVQSYLPCPFAPTSIIDCSLRFFPPFSIESGQHWPGGDLFVNRLPSHSSSSCSVSWVSITAILFSFIWGGGKDSLLFSIRILRDLRKFRVERVDQNIWFQDIFSTKYLRKGSSDLWMNFSIRSRHIELFNINLNATRNSVNLKIWLKLQFKRKENYIRWRNLWWWKLSNTKFGCWSKSFNWPLNPFFPQKWWNF